VTVPGAPLPNVRRLTLNLLRGLSIAWFSNILSFIRSSKPGRGAKDRESSGPMGSDELILLSMRDYLTRSAKGR
jgi:hypothetical protein